MSKDKNKGSTKQEYRPVQEVNIALMGKEEYFKIYNDLLSEITELTNYKVPKYGVEGDSLYVPPLLSFNSQKNRFLGEVFFINGKGKNLHYRILGFYWNGAWHHFIPSAVHMTFNDYLGYPNDEKLPDGVLYEYALKALKGCITKDSTGVWVPRDRSIDLAFKGTGFWSPEDNMTDEEYRNAPEEFWTEKLYKTSLKVDSILQDKIKEAKQKNLKD